MLKILKLFIQKGFLLDKEMLDFLNELGDESVASEIIDKIAVVSHKKIITKTLVNDNINKIKPLLVELGDEKRKLVDKYFVNVSISLEVKKERSIEDKEEREEIHKNVVKIISSPVLASQKLEVRDFVRHFRNRYCFIKQILQKNPELENLTSIDKISGNGVFSIIGMVSNKQITKNKNIILEVEDLTGKVRLLINQNKEEVYEKSKRILLDDVVGFKCSGSRDFLFVNDFFHPDCYLEERGEGDDVYAIFISDIHVGSDNFLERNFSRFIRWLNGEGCSEKEKATLKKIRYMFVVGDSIDGVGIYPGQEKYLVIKDIKKQYEKLAEYYEKIPDYISIIQCAGQHDAVRIAEPQPPISEDFAEPLYKIKNLFLVSNPSLVEVGGGRKGVRVLMYHGASMHSIINEIEELRLGKAHSTPAKVVKHLLLRSHLAPSHGEMTYIPNATEDPMLIKEAPDVITTGDLHKSEIDEYNNILIITNSCWQSITLFEEKVGNHPDPCKVPILNLKTREVRILDFSDEEDDREKCRVKDEKCEVIEKEGSSEIGEKEIVCGVK